MGDYVGDATQYSKWHINRLRGVLFYLFFSSADGGQTAGPILTSNVSKRVFVEILHSFVG